MKITNNCNTCPRMCNVDRDVQQGYCKSSNNIKINLFQRHDGEEPVISGIHGSGTIFFSNCNLSCVYCQNHKISQLGHGKEYTVKALADLMLGVEKLGVHNINLVTPTHFSLQIKEAIRIAKGRGLSLPIVWNTNSYENVETLKSLEGDIDIFLADFRYANDIAATIYSNAKNYSAVAKSAIKEMYRQVGHLKTYEGIAYRGILIRILVLPSDANDIRGILDWIAETLGLKTHISIMGQYYPTYQASEYLEINRHISKTEYANVLDLMEQYGFENYYTQEVGSDSRFTPDFK